MRGVTSNGMLCSARELGLRRRPSRAHAADEVIDPVVGVNLLEHCRSPRRRLRDHGRRNRRTRGPWRVSRDLATRLGRPLTAPPWPNRMGTSSARHSRARVSTIRTSAGDSPCRSFATCALVRRVVGEGTSSGRRHAPDLQRGRRLEPGDARTVNTHAPLRRGARRPRTLSSPTSAAR